MEGQIQLWRPGEAEVYPGRADYMVLKPLNWSSWDWKLSLTSSTFLGGDHDIICKIINKPATFNSPAVLLRLSLFFLFFLSGLRTQSTQRSKHESLHHLFHCMVPLVAHSEKGLCQGYRCTPLTQRWGYSALNDPHPNFFFPSPKRINQIPPQQSLWN